MRSAIEKPAKPISAILLLQTLLVINKTPWWSKQTLEALHCVIPWRLIEYKWRSRASFKKRLGKQFLAGYSEISLTLVRHLYSARKFAWRTVVVCIFTLCLISLYYSWPFQKKRKNNNIGMWRTQSAVAVFHMDLLFLKHRKKGRQRITQKHCLLLLCIFTFRFVQGTKFTPHCFHSVIYVSDRKVCFSGSLIRPPKKLSKITGGKQRAL